MSSQHEKEQELAALLSDMVHQYGSDMPPEPTPVQVAAVDIPPPPAVDAGLTFQDASPASNLDLPDNTETETPHMTLADIPAPDWGAKPALSMPSPDELAELDALSVPVAPPPPPRPAVAVATTLPADADVLEFEMPAAPVAAPVIAETPKAQTAQAVVVPDTVKMEQAAPAIVVSPEEDKAAKAAKAAEAIRAVKAAQEQAAANKVAPQADTRTAQQQATQAAPTLQVASSAITRTPEPVAAAASIEPPPPPPPVQLEAMPTPPEPVAAAIPETPAAPSLTLPDLPDISAVVAAAAVAPEPPAAPASATPAPAPTPEAPTPAPTASAPTPEPAAQAAPAVAAEAPKEIVPPKADSLLRERAKLHPLLEKMAEEALKRNASDIFISSNFPPAFKIDGTLVPVPLKPLTPEEAAQIVYSTFTPDLAAAFPTELELNYSIEASNGIRFRVNAYHEQGRISLVMRRITTEILTVDDLMLPQSLKELVMRKRGLLILAGATGSGKSTSMAAMLDWRNKQSAGHIVTIEDPIEYIHKPIKSIITQREVGLDTHSWGNAVHSAMRQAPDVVCVGEVRNEHAMEYALQLAQTGHLCIFTIHASNASQTIERIMNLYPEERHAQVLMDLALNLVGIIGQRLVVKKGGKGRRAIVDLLINTPAMQDHVFKNELMEARDLMERAEGDGMQTFDQHLFQLYVDGVIDYDEALRQAESANDLRLRIKLYEEGNESTHIFERVGDLNLM